MNNFSLRSQIRLQQIVVWLRLNRRGVAWSVVLLGIAFTLPPNVFSSVQTLDPRFNVLDGSWRADIPFRLSSNEWSGRDFVFTYGPLYQITHALGLLFPSHDVASLLRFQGATESVLVMLLVWATLATTQAALKWRALSYALWAFLFSFFSIETIGLKPMGAACLVALCAFRLGRKPAALQRRGDALLWACASPVALLYAFDMGVYVFVSLLIVGLIALSSTRKLISPDAQGLRQRAWDFLLATTGGFTAFCVILRLLPGWNNYLRDSLELARAYLFMLTVGISRDNLILLLIAALLCTGAIVITSRDLRRVLQNGESLSARTLSFLGLACFSLFATRAALTRSDDSHMLNAVAPCFFTLIPFALCCWHAAQRWYAPFVSGVLVFFLLLFCALFHRPVGERFAHRLAALTHPDWRRAQLRIQKQELCDGIAVARSVRSDSLLVWPIQTLVAAIVGKRNPCYTVQPYAAVTPRLEYLTVVRLKQSSAPVLFTSKLWALDDVENLTRNPLIFRFILENYQRTTSGNRVAVLLTKRSKARRWNRVLVSVARAKWQPKFKPNVALQLPTRAQTLRKTDLLLLQMRCAKTSLFPLGKPGQLTIEYSMLNGKTHKQNLLLPPDGKMHDVLFCATRANEPSFLDFFAPASAPRSSISITKMSLHWQPLDVFSIAPKQIEVERVFRLQPER